MSSLVVDLDVARSLDAIGAGIDGLFEAGLAPVNAADAERLLGELEVIGRRVDAAKNQLLDQIDGAGWYRVDGHASAKVMARHIGKLSAGEAAHRHKVMRACRDLPQVRAGFEAGDIGADQLRVIAKVHANVRVRDAMAERQDEFLADAKRLSCRQFGMRMGYWERLTDADGAAPANARTHEHRDVSLIQDHFELSWQLRGGFGAYQGADVREIFEHYIAAERLADWEKARAEHGDAACEADLVRTEAQRRADAWWQLAQDAAANPNGAVPASWVNNIVFDAATFDEMAARLDHDHQPQPLDPVRYRCETINGIPLEPHEAFANALQQAIRRVLVDSKSTVIDLGEARLFTGAARHAIKLASTTCVWPKGSSIDLFGRAERRLRSAYERPVGANSQRDPAGAPVCGRHNRWKQKGFQVWRDPTGHWHTYRPNGTKIE